MNDGHSAVDGLESFPNIWFRLPHKPTSNEAGLLTGPIYAGSAEAPELQNTYFDPVRDAE